MCFLPILNNCVEGMHRCDHVSDECTIHSSENVVLFFCESFPVGCFVIYVCVSVVRLAGVFVCFDGDVVRP